MDLTPSLARNILRAIAVGRIGLGATALVAPTVVMRPWIGDAGGKDGAALLARALGGRDLALGLGAVMAMRHGDAVRGWAEGGALADTTDALATALYFRRLPSRSRWGVLAVAAGSAAVAGVIARRVDVEG